MSDNTFSNELPDTIWAWTNSIGAQKWSAEKIVSHSREYVSAARGDEPGEAAERIARLEADLEAADEEARKLREIICDAWRKHADAEPSMFDLTNGETPAVIAPVQIREEFSVDYDDEPEQSALSDEERQVVELVKLIKDYGFRVELYAAPNRIELIVKDTTDGYTGCVGPMLAKLRSRLQPPQRPTNQEWFDIATAPVTLEAKWEAMKLLRDRHLAADKHDAAQGGNDGPET